LERRWRRRRTTRCTPRRGSACSPARINPLEADRDAGETTAVVVAVAEELVAGANCGDSGAWFVQADGRVRAALEARGVPLAETALAPRVSGDIRGSVQVSEVALSGGDAAGLARPRPG
jgi:hypothetical protein